MHASRRIFGRLCIVLAVLVTTGGTMSMAATFDVAIDSLYYQDAAGRTLDYDFSSGTMDADGVVTIPSSAYTVAPAESGLALFLEPGGGLQDVSLSGGMYHMSAAQALPAIVPIPTAAITVDGSPADWSGVAVYLQDPVGDVWWDGVPSGADVEYVKLAYSDDGSKLYLLVKLTENANTNVWYRFFLDKNLSGHGGEPGNYQVDLANFGSGWEVVSQWTDDDDNWFPVVENGVIAVSGQYLEASVDCSAFGLPANMSVFGRTELGGAPYTEFDGFLSNFEWTEASAYLFGEGDMLPAPTSYQSAVRIRGFANPGFGDSVPYLHYWGVELAGGTQQSDTIQPAVGAYWATGELEDAEMDNTLVITARVEEWGEDGSYEWSWGPETGDGVFIEGLDPSTTVVDLKIVVDNDGQTVTFYYRVNDDGAWQQATSHTLPEDTGTMYGAPTTSPVISLETGFDRAAPVYRFWNETYSRHFYTTDRAEKNKLITIYSYVWTYEGIKYYTYAEDSEPNSMPIYRFWSDSLSAHFYTIDEAERDKLINLYSHVWTYEGPCFYTRAPIS